MSEWCDLCGARTPQLAEYHLCQQHMNECVIGERDLKAERDEWHKRAKKAEIDNEKLYKIVRKWHRRTTEARAFAQKQYDRANAAEAGLLIAEKHREDAEKRVVVLLRRLKLCKEARDSHYSQWSTQIRANIAEAEVHSLKEDINILRHDVTRWKAEVARHAERAETAERRVAHLVTLRDHHRDDHHGDD